MIPVTASTSIRVATQPVDFRKQLDGIIAHCRQALSTDPMTGTLFIFINRAKTMIRVLVYDGTGFWLMTKRISKGRFNGWPRAGEAITPMTARALVAILQMPSTNEWKNLNINNV